MLGELLLKVCYALLEIRPVVDLQEATIGIEIFINELAHLIKKLKDPHTLAAEGRNHRRAEEVGELLYVELILLLLKLVPHIECDNHRDAHLAYLHSEV